MQFQYQYGRTNVGELETREACFVLVEARQELDIPKGSLCAWDLTDNTAKANVMKSTRGVGVVIYPTAEEGGVSDGKCRQAGFAHTLLKGGSTAWTIGTTGEMRNPWGLLQVFGYRNDVIADTAAADDDIVAGGILVPASESAGSVSGVTGSTTVTANELLKIVGMSFTVVAVGGSPTPIEAWVRCM